MEPLTPQDPMWKLLGQARQVEVRPNFTQNVLRAARQSGQDKDWLASVKEWLADRPGAFARVALAGGAAVVIGMLALTGAFDRGTWQSGVVVSASDPVAEAPLLAEVETQIDALARVEELLAQEDTSSLSDGEIAFLLY